MIQLFVNYQQHVKFSLRDKDLLNAPIKFKKTFSIIRKQTVLNQI